MIPSVVSNMITKSGLLLFLKQCSSKFACCEGNEFLLALPCLVDQIFKGFVQSPESWDGKVLRARWITEFEQITALLIESIPSLLINKSFWVSTYIGRIFELVKSVSAVSSSAFAEHHLCILESSIGALALGSLEAVQSALDLDNLFAVDTKSYNFRKTFVSIFLGLDPMFVFGSEKLASIPLNFLNSDFEVADDLLKWLLSFLLDGGYFLISKFPLISETLLKFMTRCLKSHTSKDYTRQLARGCVALYYRDAKKSNLKRDFDEMKGGMNHFLSLEPNIIEITIQKWISETPTPVYLLSGGKVGPDSFYARLLGDLLVDVVNGTGLEMWKSTLKLLE